MLVGGILGSRNFMCRHSLKLIMLVRTEKNHITCAERPFIKKNGTLPIPVQSRFCKQYENSVYEY